MNGFNPDSVSSENLTDIINLFEENGASDISLSILEIINKGESINRFQKEELIKEINRMGIQEAISNILTKGSFRFKNNTYNLSKICYFGDKTYYKFELKNGTYGLYSTLENKILIENISIDLDYIGNDLVIFHDIDHNNDSLHRLHTGLLDLNTGKILLSNQKDIKELNHSGIKDRTTGVDYSNFVNLFNSKYRLFNDGSDKGGIINLETREKFISDTTISKFYVGNNNELREVFTNSSDKTLLESDNLYSFINKDGHYYLFSIKDNKYVEFNGKKLCFTKNEERYKLKQDKKNTVILGKIHLPKLSGNKKVA